MKQQKDFIYQTHQSFLLASQTNGYSFITFSEYLTTDHPIKVVILRHDIEQRYENALKFAKIQNQMGIKGTYFFRILNRYFQADIIKQIAALGHEIGYHYDDLTECKGDYEKAIQRFQKNLQILRNIAPVQTICMDGSPLSPHDNKSLWGRYEYKDFDIIGEPYFDIDFDKIFYLTDTGRRWDGWKTSVRDKISQQEKWIKQGLVFHSTNDIIQAAKKNRLPKKIMITFHPQRWNDKLLPWLKELIRQNIKNQGKRILITFSSRE
jgi:hypothetical protein